MIAISSEIVLKPLPGIACLRGYGVMQMEHEGTGTQQQQVELMGAQQRETEINGGWQRCPNRDNRA